jgi:hypothetical protein
VRYRGVVRDDQTDLATGSSSARLGAHLTRSTRINATAARPGLAHVQALDAAHDVVAGCERIGEPAVYGKHQPSPGFPNAETSRLRGSDPCSLS